MNNTVVVYKTKYGHTQNYAKWIAEKLNCDLYDSSDIKVEKLFNYDNIIYGGGLYASGILGVDIITKNFDKLKNKNLIVFTVGLADPNIKSQFLPIINKNFTDEMQKKVNIFHLRGGIDYKKLGILHKAMMSALKKMVKNKKEEEMTDEDKMMLNTYGEVVDFTDKTTIEPLISYVNSIVE